MPPVVMRRGMGCWLALLLPALLGCGPDKATVSGTVRYEGEELDNGFITFFPADGRGATSGAEISAGRYSVANVQPGKKRVYVTTPLKPAPGSGALGQELRLLPPTRPVPRDARGNNQVVEVHVGGQTLDLRLRKPATKR